MSGPPILDVRGLCVGIWSGKTELSAVADVSFRAYSGQVVALGLYGAVRVATGSRGGWTEFGLQRRVTRAVAIRAAQLGYAHSWVSSLNGANYQNGFQLSSGIVLRMGTW